MHAGSVHYWVIVTAYSPRSIMQGTLSETAQGVDIAGDWAGFNSPIGREYQQGPVTGSGRSVQDGAAMAVTLVFRSALHRTSHEVSYLVEHDPARSTRAEFIREMEAASLLPSLLYHEMIPHGTGLSRAIEKLLPSLPGQRVVVPFIDPASAPQVDVAACSVRYLTVS